jgi:hypothetical protein
VAVRVVGEVRSLRRGKAILQPIVVCWWIVVVKAPQKRVGERDRGGGMCVGCEAQEGVLELGTDSHTEVVPAPQGGRLW